MATALTTGGAAGSCTLNTWPATTPVGICTCTCWPLGVAIATVSPAPQPGGHVTAISVPACGTTAWATGCLTIAWPIVPPPPPGETHSERYVRVPLGLQTPVYIVTYCRVTAPSE